jgi:hypothetical protein
LEALPALNGKEYLMREPIIHFRVDGEPGCGKKGRSTGILGNVSCKECRELKAYKALAPTAPGSKTIPHRYHVRYGSEHHSPYRHVVYDTQDRRVAFGSNAKSEVIWKAQQLNRFDPLDGSEATYGEQIRGEQHAAG